METKPKIEKDAAPLTAISVAANERDSDSLLWSLVRLHLHNLRYLEAGTKDYTAAVTSLSKLAIDIKKTQPVSDSSKEEMLSEMMAYLNKEN